MESPPVQLILSPLPNFTDKSFSPEDCLSLIPSSCQSPPPSYPHPWQDRSQYYKDIQSLDLIYEEYLNHLSEILNILHGSSHPLDYYRIILGPWLGTFIPILYERFISLKSISLNFNITKTLTLHPQNFSSFTPPSTCHALLWQMHHPYNLFLYSIILHYSNLLIHSPVSCKLNPLPELKQKHSFIKSTLSKIPNKYNHVFLSSYFQLKELIKLNLSLKQLPYIPPPPPSSLHRHMNLNLRSHFRLPSSTSEFKTLLNKILPLQIPLSFIENYSFLNKQLDKMPKKPKSIFTANPEALHDLLKLFCAHHKTYNNTPLLIGQHGGHFGSGLFCTNQSHHLKTATQYFSWGWTLPNHQNITPLPAPKLINLPKRSSLPPHTLLIAANTYPKYYYRPYTAPPPALVPTYFQDYVSFFNHLTPNIQKDTLLRPPPQDYGWNEKALLSTIPSYQGKASFLKQLPHAKIFVSFSNTTTFLQSLAANIPTILILNPKFWELHPHAIPLFNSLKTANILHASPPLAANFINSIWHDTPSWWLDPKTQSIVRNFTNHFALTSKSPLTQWKETLKDLPLNNLN